jgi:probable rRNA maturation factor
LTDQTYDLSIVVTTNLIIQRLNKKYLGGNSPTDVLSFPSLENNCDTGNIYLGDVVLAYPYVNDQALSLGVPFKNELVLLLIHGILHLLGYNHGTPEMKTNMWRIQERTFEQIFDHQG